MVSDAHDTSDTSIAVEGDADAASAQYVGKWNRLVSRTNWEKGRIICQWKEALVEGGRPAYEYSDESWATRVGGISAQHVGRLRRVWQRFGASFEEYDGLYWSHFLVAMDWDDAEMWLEGAARSGWSVSQMRAARWEAIGAPAELKPRDEDVYASDWDEDSPLRPVGDGVGVVHPQQREADDADQGNGDWDRSAETSRGRGVSSIVDEAGDGVVRSRSDRVQHSVRPFAALPELPDDLAEAFEQFKIAILAHRMSGWQEISSDDVAAALEALKALALAPLEDDSE